MVYVVFYARWYSQTILQTCQHFEKTKREKRSLGGSWAVANTWRNIGGCDEPPRGSGKFLKFESLKWHLQHSDSKFLKVI